MIKRSALVCAAWLWLLTAGNAEAARGRYHYVPIEPHGTMSPAPGGPRGVMGERISVLGTCTDANPPCPTCFKCFRHPCTGQTIIVPLALPEGTPVIYHRRDRVSFNYGSYAVDVLFLPDGSVDVIYNSGLFRAL